MSSASAGVRNCEAYPEIAPIITGEGEVVRTASSGEDVIARWEQQNTSPSCFSIIIQWLLLLHYLLSFKEQREDDALLI